MSDTGSGVNPFLGFTPPVYDNTPDPSRDLIAINARAGAANQAAAASQASQSQLQAANAVLNRQQSFQSNITSYVSKWQSIAPYADRIGKKAIESIRDYDAQRIASGRSPLTKSETAMAILAARNHQAQTQEPDRGHGPLDIVSNFVGDMPALLKGAANIVVSPIVDVANHVTPGAWTDDFDKLQHAVDTPGKDWQDKLAKVWHAGVDAIPGVGALPEVKELGATPQGLTDLYNKIDRERGHTSYLEQTGDMIGGIAKLPGFRLIPGSMAVGVGAQEGGKAALANAAEHPLLQLLDVLPFAEAGAKATTVGRTALEGGARHALPALLTNKLDEAGNLERNLVGRRVDTAKASPVGNGFDQMWGKLSRETAGMSSDYDQALNKAIHEPNLDLVPQEIKGLAGFKELRQLTVDAPDMGIPAERIPVLHDLAIVGDPRELAKLPTNEFEFVSRARDLSKSLADQAIDRTGELIRDGVTGEAYRPAEWKNYSRRQGLRERLNAKVIDSYGVGNGEGRLARWSVESADPRMGALHDAIAAGDYERAKTLHGAMSKNFVAPGVKNVGLEEGPKGLMSSETWSNLGKDLDRLKRLDKGLANKPLPARFTGTVAKKVGDEIIARVDPAVRDEAIAAILQGRYKDALIPTGRDLVSIEERGISVAEWQKREVAKLTAEISKTWEDPKAEGFDPVFVSRSADRNAIQYPSIRGGKIETPSYVKKREVLPSSGYEHDIQLGLTHQAVEMVTRQMQEAYAQEIIDAFGRPSADVLAEFEPRAQRLLEKNPTWDHAKAMDKAMSRRVGKFAPEEVFGANHKILGAEDVMLPRVVLQTLERLNSSDIGKLQTVLDPVTGLFRMSVVGLSVRNNINNALGGLMLSIVEDPGILKPAHMFRGFRQAKSTFEFAKDMGDLVGDDLSKIEQLRNSASMNKHLAELGSQKSDVMELQYAAGGKLRKVAEKAGWLKNIPEKNLWLNNFVDDMFKGAQLSRGIEKALKAGKPLEGAAAEGLALVRKVSLNWRMLTPLERAFIRPLIPFYSWLRHITQFTFHYPLDHPVRAEILGALMRTELEDQKTGLPAAMRDLFFLNGVGDLGRPGAASKQTAINVGSFNPFGDPQASWGLLGFLTGDAQQAGASLASTSPVLKVAMETLGFDPRSGTADIYPELSYDPRAGGLVPTSKNPLVNIATSVVPQAGSAMKLLGLDPQFKDMARTNPEAAKRALWSGVGVPMLWRGVDVDREFGKAEVTRYQAQQTEISQAIKTGDYEAAAKYPGLREMIGQIKQLQTAHPELFMEQNVAQISADDVRRQLVTLGGG